MRPSLRPWVPVLLLMLALGLVGCRGSRPEDAFQAFYSAVARGDADAAWQHFSKDTQRKLESFLERSRPPGDAPKPAAALLFDSGLLRTMREVAAVEVLTQSRGKAVLQITDELGEKQQVTLVREDDAWRLQLEIPEA